MDTSNAPPAQFTQKNQSLDVVVFQQTNVRTHVGDVPYVDHDEGFEFGEFVFVEPALEVFVVFFEVEAEGPFVEECWFCFFGGSGGGGGSGFRHCRYLDVL